MKTCPAGAIVNKPELKTLLRVLDVAIEERVVLIDCNMPPKGVKRSADDELDFAVWSGDIRRWRKLRSRIAEALK